MKPSFLRDCILLCVIIGCSWLLLMWLAAYSLRAFVLIAMLWLLGFVGFHVVKILIYVEENDDF